VISASDPLPLESRAQTQSQLRSHVPSIAAALAFAAGTCAALHYARAGLALSHYDARAHLVVARRVFDSLTPGWQQIGAVWLPLPHLLNMVPVQIDAFYRTGASAIAISVCSMAVACWALAALLFRRTGSASAAFAGLALLIGNPNVLYLQSTPMSEPLLFATVLVTVYAVVEWIERPRTRMEDRKWGMGDDAMPHAAAAALAAACMTRYEAWPIAAAVVVLTGAVLLRRGTAPAATALACLRLASYALVAIAVFIVNSRWTTGEWFVGSGFFVPENDALGRPMLAWHQVRDGVYALSSATLVRAAYLSAMLVAFVFAFSRTRASLVLVLAPSAAAALPWYAYVHGHPFRIRYSVPLVAASAVLTATGVALLPRRLRPFAALGVVGVALWQSPPLPGTTALLAEAQRDAPNRAGRAAVTRYLVQHYRGEPVMMSMGSLAHYMQDLSNEGFHIRNFLHEGNNDLWVYAVQFGPRGFAPWVVIEERAEGGDVLFQRAKQDPTFLEGYERVAEGGGAALYRLRSP